MQKEILLTKQAPELINDITLFKLFFTPLELLTLKYFLIELRPINIREVYTLSLYLLFDFVFNPDYKSNITPVQERLVVCLVNAGYGGFYPSTKNKEKIFSKVYRDKNSISETDLHKNYYKALKEIRARVPSYEKFQTIFKNFEKIGVIYKREKQGKVILYGLNPKFYNLFKDKIEEIKKL